MRCKIHVFLRNPLTRDKFSSYNAFTFKSMAKVIEADLHDI